MNKKLLLTALTAASLSWIDAGATIHSVSVGVSGNNYSPTSITTVSLGDTVRWTIVSGTHDVVSCSVPSGAATFASSLPMPTTFDYVPTLAGNYTYRCTPHSTASCTGMVGSFTVSCSTGPTRPAITSSNGSTACQGAAVMLSTPAQGGATYQWFNGTTSVSGATSNSLNATTAGNYKVRVTRCSLIDSSVAFTVTINPVPVPTFTFTGTGNTRTFTNTTAGSGMTYLWDFGDGTTSTAASPSKTWTTSGAKIVKLTATTTATACNATSQQTINVSLGVATIGSGETFTITPNPVTDVINVSASATSRPALQLFDMAGRMVSAPAIDNGRSRSVNVQNVPAGLYLLRITTANGTAVEQITIAH